MPEIKFNEHLLREVQKAILAKPKSFHMADWREETECGTEMCIAGHVVALTGKRVTERNAHLIPERARKALGLTPDETYVLFYDDHWPKDICNAYYRAELAHSHRRMAIHASHMIDWFIMRKKKGRPVWTGLGGGMADEE